MNIQDAILALTSRSSDPAVRIASRISTRISRLARQDELLRQELWRMDAQINPNNEATPEIITQIEDLRIYETLTSLNDKHIGQLAESAIRVLQEYSANRR
jgi:hypothetical protein